MVSHRRIRLLIVDDSRFIRMALRAIVDNDPEIEVVGEARDGADAIALARVLRPDVITMDLEMPEVDGLSAIKAIMAERPTPILVLSGHTRTGVWITFQALGCGAVDFMEKPTSLESMVIKGIQREFLDKIHHWARRPHGAPWGAVRPAQPWGAGHPSPQPWGAGHPVQPWSPPAASAAPFGADRPAVPESPPIAEFISAEPGPGGAAQGSCDLVVVAVSTGGPKTMPVMLNGMGGALDCPMVVAQHMPSLFTSGFAEHLALATGIDVVEGVDSMPLPPGRIVIIAGGCDGEIVRTSNGLCLRQRRAGEQGIHPSGDALFESAASAARQPAAVVLTGIGNDGTFGASFFANRQFPVFAQAPSTAVVWGMPSAVIEAGYATRVLSVERIGSELSRLCGRQSPTPRDWPSFSGLVSEG